ncbi:transcriptional regulator, TetR family [Pseudomonas vancouverensis]|uniref:TetR/AcrR family transcriptional regulator n=2 Tax=Pseudomonas vancouverensis TaxID=95300 RepID=A0A1H2NXW7_PSEVA|nr:TetR/AcrR family transcriptional regulator [Pseudomonas vancouverensis]TDB64748.1 TetR/AcrR family transcriptional regulator [Pseudomonas vancouverensis]SDV10297.1 transcriptional regulator, TetR family [Pseudomonas vancouverensis]
MSHLARVQMFDKNIPSQRHALRSQRTRELLLDHMYRLALEKGYEGITVQQLLDSSGVARSTFYAHFRDKEDLIVAGYEAIGIPATKVTEVDGDRRVVLDVSTWLFSATERHAALTTAFFSGPGQNVILAHLENILIIQVREHYRKQGLYQTERMRGEAAVRCFVGALVGLWLWWVRHDYPNSAQEMTETFDSLMNNGTWPPTCSVRE